MWTGQQLAGPSTLFPCAQDTVLAFKSCLFEADRLISQPLAHSPSAHNSQDLDPRKVTGTKHLYHDLLPPRAGISKKLGLEQGLRQEPPLLQRHLEPPCLAPGATMPGTCPSLLSKTHWPS